MSKLRSWDDLQAFLAVLEEGSLSGAARRLGVSHATVRARVEALEATVGTVLFTRSVNGLLPTETAESLRQTARTMATASELFVRQAAAAPGKISGVVRISVSEFMGIEVLPRMLAELRQSFPDLVIELTLSNDVADLVAQEVDIAVRTFPPSGDWLLGRKVGAIPLGMFAAPDYLSRRGTPLVLADIAAHDLIGPDRGGRDLQFIKHLAPHFNTDRLVFRTDSHPAQAAAARAGVGIAIMQVPAGARDRSLVRVLPDLTVAHLETWVLTHQSLKRVPRIQAVMRSLAGQLADYSRTGTR